MKGKMPRILFAAPKSGSGKTTVVCGMLEICNRRNYRTVSFKCGPDYIDPMFHRKVLGAESGNLDTFFTDAETVRYLLKSKAEHADFTILEGVMGYYDGLGGTTESGSTYEIAKVTDTPVILVVDAKGASVTLAAVINGLAKYRKDSRICGVILNRVSEGYYQRLKEIIEKECSLKVLGYVPELPELAVPSRHLGLFTPKEVTAFQKWAGKIADVLERTLELSKIFEIAEAAEYCTGKAPKLPVLSGRVRLAVARDEAFSFYYAENMELLEKLGAELVYFSPLHDKALPDRIDGLLLFGGYPENYVKELEASSEMRESIWTACQNGIPCLAECGGFLYLQKELEGAEGNTGKMTGVLSGRGFRTKKLCRFGYIELESEKEGVFGESGQKIKGHEFHYWDCTENGEAFLARKPVTKKEYSCMVYTESMAAGFPHLYYYSNPSMLFEFLLSCQRAQAGRMAKEHWDSIAKPLDSLGLLEDSIVRLCRITGDSSKIDIKKRALVILCSDHKVVEEGVTQTGKEVTKVVSENFAKGCSSVNYMARSAKVDVYTIDAGMDTLPYTEKQLVQNAVIDRKIKRGSGNIAKESALTRNECRQALESGKEIVRELKEKGYRILATGEMGIGNTTPTSVLAAVFLEKEAEEVTGKGAGLSKEGLQRKKSVVKAAIDRIIKKGLAEKKKDCALEILAEAGGCEIAMMAGVFLGGAKYHLPVVIDGAISAVAALTAMYLDQRVKEIVFASHEPEERAGKMALKALGVKPLVHGRLCLGEGTGAMTLFPLLDMATEVYQNMGTFASYEIEPYIRYQKEE